MYITTSPLPLLPSALLFPTSLLTVVVIMTAPLLLLSALLLPTSLLAVVLITMSPLPPLLQSSLILPTSPCPLYRCFRACAWELVPCQLTIIPRVLRRASHPSRSSPVPSPDTYLDVVRHL